MKSLENRSPSRIVSKTCRNSLCVPKNPIKENDLKGSPGLSLKFIKKKSQGCSPLLDETPSPGLPVRPSRKSLNCGNVLGKTEKNVKNLTSPRVFKLITPKFSKDFAGFYSTRNSVATSIMLEDYEFVQVIGQGMLSVVRKAVCRKNGTIVAIKSYDKSKWKSQGQHVNIKQEIEILSKISHKNIVDIIDTFETESEFHLVTEYITGISLYSYLKKHVGTRILENEAKMIFEQIFAAVEYLHDNNIAHGDLKLENILITSGDIVKIIDFGFSSYCHQKRTVFCGTSSYLSPEITQMVEYFPAPADIWALGVIFFTLLTGTYPFKASSDSELFKKIQKGHAKVPDIISNEAGRLLGRMLRIDPKMRSSIKHLIKDPWFTCESQSEKDPKCKLSLSNSLIKDNSQRNSKRSETVVEKAKGAWKISLKKLLTVDK